MADGDSENRDKPFLSGEVSYAARGFCSPGYYQVGSEIVYPLPEETGGDESEAQRSITDDQEFLGEVAIWIARVWVAAWVVSILVVLWQNEKTRLEVLNATTRTLNTVALAIGTWAMRAEKAYYDTVNSLH